MVFRRVGEPLEGVVGGLRRKSLRISDVGCGSEMLPKEEPERRFLALRWRLFRKQ
jgi:hypothetical protein